jgi:hypothetical protein
MSPYRRRSVSVGTSRRRQEERQGETEKRLRRCRTAAGRSRGGSGRNQKRASPCDDGRRHFVERANICSWIRSLKGCQIRALEDGQGIGIVSSEGEKGRTIPLCDISLGGVKIPINFILVARERGKEKKPWTNERRRHRGGVRRSRRGGGGREECRRRRKIFRKIHNFFYFFI